MEKQFLVAIAFVIRSIQLVSNPLFREFSLNYNITVMVSAIIATITAAIVKMLKRFKNWLKDSRDFLFSWYTTDSTETQEPERSLVELPQSIKQKLVNEVENIPSSPSDKDAIASTLDRTFELWRKDQTYRKQSALRCIYGALAGTRLHEKACCIPRLEDGQPSLPEACAEQQLLR